MGESDVVGLLRHGAADLWNAVADADNRGLAGSSRIAAAIGGVNPTPLAAHGNGVVFSEVAGEKRGSMRDRAHIVIVAKRGATPEDAPDRPLMRYSFAGLEDSTCLRVPALVYSFLISQ